MLFNGLSVECIKLSVAFLFVCFFVVFFFFFLLLKDPCFRTYFVTATWHDRIYLGKWTPCTGQYNRSPVGRVLCNYLNIATWLINAAHGCGIYICGRSCACGTFQSFPFVHIVLEEFDYTARVQHVLHTTGYSWVELFLDNISLSRLIRVFFY